MDNTTLTKSALIAGAGIGGLAAAIALAQHGVSVRVIERNGNLGELGAGLQLSPNAMKALGALGVDAAVNNSSFEPQNATICDGITGKNHVNLPLKDLCQKTYGAPYLHTHRADLHDALRLRAVKLGVDIRTSQAVTGYRADKDNAALLLNDTTELTADVIVGADGVRSVIAAQMHPEIAPKFTGQVAWRGVVPADELPADLIPPNATVWIGAGQHLVTYYLRGGTLINFVAVQERSDWLDPSWTQTGDLTELRTAFTGWHPCVTALLAQTQKAHLWALFDRDELPNWSDGAVTLLGDACHPTLPFMAQGAAMSLEDAVVLAKCLAAEPPRAALTTYEKSRKTRTTKLQNTARANGTMFHAQTPWQQTKLTVAGLLPGRLGFLPVERIYSYDPTK